MRIQIRAVPYVLLSWKVEMQWLRIATSTMVVDPQWLMVEMRIQMCVKYNNVGTVPNIAHQISVT